MDKQDSSKDAEAPKAASLFASLNTHITKWGSMLGAIATLITVGLGTLAVGLKFFLSAQMADFVANDPRFVESFVAAVKAELAKPQDRLSGTFDEMLQKQRAGEVGALTAGSFLMRKDRMSYTLYLYLPKGHTGQLNLSVDWWPKSDQPEKDLPFIIVQFPDPWKATIKKGGPYTFNLPNRPSTTPSFDEGNVVQPSAGALDNLYAITFVAGGDVPAASAEIKFAAFVHPTIRIEGKK